jgi:uncharacterized protein YaaR (DUF327 family)
MLDYQKQFLEKISVVLSGMKIPESTCIPRKALLLKERFFKNTVKVIDQNIKDFVQAQIQFQSVQIMLVSRIKFTLGIRFPKVEER